MKPAKAALPVGCSSVDDLFVTKGVYKALEHAFKSPDFIDRDSAEYAEITAAYASIAHIFNPILAEKYKDACRPENVEFWRRVYDGEESGVSEDVGSGISDGLRNSV